jgi:acyl-homoserine-lactone acylase
VEIRRTDYGVPHILGQTLEAGAYGLAWVMMEDYREEVPRQLLESNGRWARVEGRPAVSGSYSGMMTHQYAEGVFPQLPPDVQEIHRGFAAGVNDFIRVYADELPAWVQPEFTPQDVAAKDMRVWDQGAVAALQRQRQEERGVSALVQREETGDPAAARGEIGTGEETGDPALVQGASGARENPDPDVGSNAWAFAPERTRSGHAILVRNPHLSYTSGYYEAHLTVPGVLNFYGDFRLGGPFGIIGGFSDRLGWSTTNNYGDPDQIYALLKDPEDPDAYLFDGGSVPIATRSVTVEFLDADSLAQASRDFRFTPLGPVLLEVPDTVFVLKTPTLSQPRLGEQWLRMMQAQDLEEWKEAMRIRAKYSSNFTYADADGNIFYVWNASVPVLPHQPSDGAPVFAAGWDDVWTELYPWDSLPQLLNPRGGYVQNSNDSPYYTNLHEPLDPDDFPSNFPEPRLRLRSQLSLSLIDTDQILTLEEVVELKHSMRMLLADRVKDELIGTVLLTSPEGDVLRAVDLLASWDNRAARESRGGVLFKLWADRYFDTVEDGMAYTTPWTPDEPTSTPRGLGDPEAAVEALRWAMEEGVRRFGAWDVTWGEVHRLRADGVDLPVGGCTGSLGCFRVIGFRNDDDGAYRARTGDAWILAVEFGEIPRAYSVLAYGNSNRPESPWYYNQAELFANNRLKVVVFTESDIQRNLVERYRPGEGRGR